MSPAALLKVAATHFGSICSVFWKHLQSVFGMPAACFEGLQPVFRVPAMYFGSHEQPILGVPVAGAAGVSRSR